MPERADPLTPPSSSNFVKKMARHSVKNGGPMELA